MTLRFAILGTSGIARTHVRLLRSFPHVEVAAVWGGDAERVNAFAHAQQIPRALTNLQTILDDASIDALLILTEPARHIPLAKQGLAAGKHMLIEKPLGNDLAEARAFFDAARKTNLIIGVISQFRFNPILRAIKSTIEEMAPNTPKAVILSIMWSRSREYYQQGSGWRAQESPVLLNQGIHWLDVMNWFFGQPRHVHGVSLTTRAFLQCADFSSALIAYPDNATVQVSAGTFCDKRYDDQMTIFHPGGRLDYAEMARPKTTRKWLFGGSRAQPIIPDLLSLQLADYIKAVQEQRPPEVTLTHGLQAIELAFAASQNLVASPGDGQ